MDPQGYVVVIAAISRSIGLLIAGIGAICCIFLGWSLYRDGIKVATAGTFDYGNFKIKLSSLGPGVFLVAFGAAILLYLIARPANINMPEPDCPTIGSQPKNPSNFLSGSLDSNHRVNMSTSSFQPFLTRFQNNSSKPPPASCKPCRVWSVNYLEGAPPIHRYEDALNMASKALILELNANKNADTNNESDQLENLRNAIDRLRELRENLNEN